MQISFAPMEGITNYRYRRIHAQWFGAADRYFTPFLMPNQTYKFTTREKNDILPAHNAGLVVIPQILTNHTAYCLWAIEQLSDLGYEEVNLNLGCPSGTVVIKNRGAGQLADLQALDRFLDTVCTASPIRVSVKTRLGIKDPQEFADILTIYNRYPLTEVIIHPRVQKAFYTGHADWTAFGQALHGCQHPVCYNGDLFCVSDYQRFCQTFPTVERIMLARGWIANPDLGNQIRAKGVMNLQRLQGFHDALYADYRATLSGDTPVLFKMKELWFYMHSLFADSEKPLKHIRKAKRLTDYQMAVKEMFEKPLICDGAYHPIR